MVSIAKTTDLSSSCTVDSYQQVSFKRQNSDDGDQLAITQYSHKRECTEKYKLVVCPFAELGCTSTSPIRYEELLEHYSSPKHCEILLKAIESYVKEIHMRPFLQASSQQQPENSDNNDILESIKILAEGVSCLHDGDMQMHKNFVQILSHIVEQQKDMSKLKSSMDEVSLMISAVDTDQKVLRSEVDTLRQMTSDSLSSSSSDGSFFWKVTNVAEKLADAAEEKQSSFYSPSFYSSPSGYKMCLRLYMNGDGQARSTHLSLFLVLMRGDYDAILTWPFSYKVTFCLYDQTGKQRHIIDSFIPDIKSNSFQRPRSNMNIAAGIPRFLPLSIIKSMSNPYVLDNCMFIRCFVEFVPLPKMCIPFMFNLNPGLPLSSQQKAIKAEAETYMPPAFKATTTVETSDTKINT